MPSTLGEIDTRHTFERAILMAIGPKLEYGTGAQATSAQGVPKWEARSPSPTWPTPGCAHSPRSSPSPAPRPRTPAKDIAPGTSVEFDGLRVGISAPEQRSNDRGIVGGKPWFQATGLRPSL